MQNDRRLFLKFLGAGFSGVAFGASPLGPLADARGAMPVQQSADGFSFNPIQPTSRDELVLPAGFTYDLVAQWGDRLPGTNARVGYNADYTAFIPTGGGPPMRTAQPALARRVAQRPDLGEGVLFVNHEYVSLPDAGEIGVYLQTFPLVIGRAPRIGDEMHDVGGTMANCSGCHTPWNTVLTCEENFQDYVPETVDTSGRGMVGGRWDRNGAHFGWVVEIDPLDPEWTPVKHTMLGRFRHENVALRAEAGRPVIAYMGDDRINGHVYRFVSEERYRPGGGATRGAMLARGRLHAAVFNADGTGEWRELAPATPLRPNPGSTPTSGTRRSRTTGCSSCPRLDRKRASPASWRRRRAKPS